MKEERYVLVGSTPELVTLADGRVVSLFNGHDPVALHKDSRFRRLRSKRRLKKVMVEVEEEPKIPTSAMVAAQRPDPEPEEAAPAEEVEEVSEETTVTLRSVEELVLDSSTEELLIEAGYETIEELHEASDEELLDIKGIGPKTLEEVREALSSLE